MFTLWLEELMMISNPDNMNEETVKTWLNSTSYGSDRIAWEMLNSVEDWVKL